MMVKDKSKSNKLIARLSLFNGAGGLDIGFQKAGINIQLVNEKWDEKN